MFKTKYNQFYPFLFATFIALASSSVNVLSEWSPGYYGDMYILNSIKTEWGCASDCWNEIMKGKVVVGASRDNVWCYCIVKSILSNVAGPVNNNRHVEFLLSYITTKISTYSIGDYATFRIGIRFFSEGNDESSFSFIDDLNEPLKQSGRLIITSLVDFQRNFYNTRVMLRHNESHLLNSVQETYVGSAGINTEYENFYDVVAKVGDMSVENGHTHWGFLIVSNVNSMWLHLIPFTITRREKKCSVSDWSSSGVFGNMLHITFHITTSYDCVTDLENLTIILNPQSNLIFTGDYWDDLSVKTVRIIQQKQNIFHIPKLFIASYTHFSIYYTFPTSSFVGDTNINIAVKIISHEFENNTAVLRKKAINYGAGLKKPPNQDLTTMYPKMVYNNINGTVFVNGNYQFVCKPILKRQQSSCYVHDKSSAKVTFLPIQMNTVIGYIPESNLVYGYTFQNNVIQYDLTMQIPMAIITTKKWNAIKKGLNLK